ncbi:MAG: SurA N-terminal domain-containing protein [Deltaproteobacteria bacterium]|nr:SurA N-terminal domain-containing protein [Deltaproteobacteria bacterium]
MSVRLRSPLLLLAPLVLAALLAAPARAEVVNRIAAIVDEDVITVFQIEREAAPTIQAYLSSNKEATPEERDERIAGIKQEKMRELIERKLLETEVRRLGIPVEETDVDQQIQQILDMNRMSREDLADTVAREGKTMEEFRDEIRKRILREQYVRFRLKDKVEVDEEDVRAYYQQHPEEFVAGTTIGLAEIRFNLPAEADQEQVRAVFERAAATY